MLASELIKTLQEIVKNNNDTKVFMTSKCIYEEVLPLSDIEQDNGKIILIAESKYDKYN